MAGFKLAVEVNKAAKGPTLKDFKEKLAEESFRVKVEELKHKIEAFAIQFPMPGHTDV